MKELTDILQEILGYDYRLERELPGGGMSRLFLATERSLDRRVVVKVLPPELVCEPMIARFKREIEVTAGLLHPHVLPVLTAGARDDILYYVMPYVEGESLRHRLNREGRLPMEDALRLLAEVADALAYAHARGVVHRDIKPENILLSGGHALLADFGIARAIRVDDDGRQQITTPGLPLGTYGYAPPEQVRGDRPADARADVYALSVVGYEMLTGEMPPAHPVDAEPRRRALIPAFGRRSAMRVTVARRETPMQVSRAIMRALSAAPEDRYQTAADFRDALREPYGRQVARRRRAWRRLAILATATIAIAGVAYLLYDPDLVRHRVVVARFDAVDPALQPWREGVADMLARNFDGAGPLRTVSARVAFRRETRGDDSSAVELGRTVGAQFVIAGTLRRIGGDSVRLQATLYERLRLGTKSLGTVEFEDVESRIAIMADNVTLRFLDTIGQQVDLRAGGRPPLLGARSIPALKDFLRGEQFFRRNQYESARAAYESALRADSLFALAHWRMRATLRTIGDEWNDSSFVFARIAGRLNQGLGRRDSLLVLADSLYAAAPDITVRDARLRFQRRRLQVLEDAARWYSEDAEILMELGEARLHFGHRFGVSWSGALEAFERAVRHDPAYAPAYYHVVQLRGTLHGLDSAAAALRAQQRHAPGDPRAPVLAEIARTGAVNAAALRDTGLSEAQRTQIGVMIWRWPGPTPPAIAARALRTGRDSAASRAGYIRLLALHGRLADLARLGKAPDWQASEHAAVFGGLTGSLPAARIDSLTDGWLLTGGPRALHAGLAWWSARGDMARLHAADQRAREQARFPAADPDWGYARRAATAHLALARRDTTGALRELLALPDSACSWWCANDQIVRARLLVARGERERAESLFAAHPPMWDAIRAEEVLWMLERGRLAEGGQRRREAEAAYDYVRRFWAHADAPLRDTARVAAAALVRVRRAR